MTRDAPVSASCLSAACFACSKALSTAPGSQAWRSASARRWGEPLVVRFLMHTQVAVSDDVESWSLGMLVHEVLYQSGQMIGVVFAHGHYLLLRALQLDKVDVADSPRSAALP